jgi:hypothetical protein
MAEVIPLHDDIIREERLRPVFLLKSLSPTQVWCFSHLVGPLAPLAYAICNQANGQGAEQNAGRRGDTRRHDGRLSMFIRYHLYFV